LPALEYKTSKSDENSSMSNHAEVSELDYDSSESHGYISLGSKKAKAVAVLYPK